MAKWTLSLRSRLRLAFLLLLHHHFHEVSSFTMGAPDSACARMEPGHGFSPQSGSGSDVPVRLFVDRKTVIPGGQVAVRLEASGTAVFKGFLIQARDSSKKDEDDSQVGSFVVEDDASYMTCFSGIHNSITHRNSEPKTSVEATWRAPEQFEGDVTFRYSFVQEYDRYWVRQDTDTIRVARDVDGDTGAADSSDSRVQFPDDEEQQGDETVTENPAAEVTSSVPTTTSTTTTTTSPRPTSKPTERIEVTEPPRPNFVAKEHQIFEGCGDTKACFGLNDNNENCLGNENDKCLAVVSYELSGDKWLFKMTGRSNGYVAVGLSFDDQMGDDLTAGCYYANNEVGILAGFNKGKSNEPLNPPRFATEEFQGSFEDGFITCEFKWPLTVQLKEYDMEYNLGRDEYVILLAQGPFANGVLQYHTRKIKSSEPQALGIASNLAGASRLFIQLHGSFMIGAWIFSASCGIFLARYFKQTWTNSKMCKLDQWFIWHRTFMMTTWGLTIAGFVLIFLELNGWTDIPISQNPHALLGCITTGLCFMQPFIAMLRCAPDARRRPIFNWVHWFVGNAAQIVGVVAIFFAVELDKAGLPRETDYLLIAFIAFHFLMHLVLSIHQCMSDMRKDKQGYAAYPMRNLNGHKGGGGGLYPDYEEVKRDAPGAGVRKFFFVLYLLVSAVAATALILLVIYGDFSNVID